ncbi:MAG: sedoheptulokinase [Anaerolineae bacterium]
MLLIGLDVGTTKLAALAVEADTGQTVALVATPNTARRDAAVNGLQRAELDVGQLQALALDLLRQLRGALPPDATVIGLGVTGQQHGVAFVDQHGQPTLRAITWQDQRVLEPVDSATYLEALVAQAGGSGRFEGMGCAPAPGYLGASLYWLSRRGELPAPAGACLIPDSVVAALVGAAPATDPTLAGSTALYDVRLGRWDRDLLDRLGLGTVRLAEVAPTGALAGGLASEAAQHIGLRRGTPVAVAVGDNQASFIGSVSAPQNSLLVNIGTGGQVSAWIDRFVRVDTIDTRAFPGGRYLLVGAGSSGGSTLAHLHRLVAEIGASLYDAERDDLYERLIDLAAAQPPGAEGLRCVPHLNGTRADPTATGAWLGLTGSNLTIGNLTRALIEGIANDTHAFWERMRLAAGKRERLVGAGNALVRNRVLQEALSQRFHMPLELATREEAAAVGAALCAGVAVGQFRNVDEAMATGVCI